MIWTTTFWQAYGQHPPEEERGDYGDPLFLKFTTDRESKEEEERLLSTLEEQAMKVGTYGPRAEEGIS